MAYSVLLQQKAHLEFVSLSKKDQLRVAVVLLDVAANPFSGTRLKGELEGAFTIRAWPLCIAYTIFQHELIVLGIQSVIPGELQGKEQ